MVPVKTGDLSDLIYSPARNVWFRSVVRVEIDVVSPSRKMVKMGTRCRKCMFGDLSEIGY